MTKFFKDESGQGMLEYVLIIAIVALAAVGIILLISNKLKNKKNDIANQLENAGL